MSQAEPTEGSAATRRLKQEPACLEPAEIGESAWFEQARLLKIYPAWHLKSHPARLLKSYPARHLEGYPER
eukprot:scaffold5849_cov21-Tisochrysis_lutea.AAC.4